MKKIGVIYWSGTGNKKLMAEAVLKGASSTDSEVTISDVNKIKIDEVSKYDAIALGCPAMGFESVEESVMLPFVKGLNGLITGKKIALFGSYGWGIGEWMEDWEKQIEAFGGVLIQEGLKVEEEPGDDELRECHELGANLLLT